MGQTGENAIRVEFPVLGCKTVHYTVQHVAEIGDRDNHAVIPESPNDREQKHLEKIRTESKTENAWAMTFAKPITHMKIPTFSDDILNVLTKYKLTMRMIPERE